MSGCDDKVPIVGSNLFRVDMAMQGLEVGGRVFVAVTLLSAPFLQCAMSIWEACMVLVSPEADRPQQCNVCKRSVPIQAINERG